MMSGSLVKIGLAQLVEYRMLEGVVPVQPWMEDFQRKTRRISPTHFVLSATVSFQELQLLYTCIAPVADSVLTWTITNAAIEFFSLYSVTVNQILATIVYQNLPVKWNNLNRIKS